MLQHHVSWTTVLHVGLTYRYLSVLDLLTSSFLTDTMLLVKAVRRNNNSILSCPTCLRGREGGGGGPNFEVCLSVLLGGEGGRRAAAR